MTSFINQTKVIFLTILYLFIQFNRKVCVKSFEENDPTIIFEHKTIIKQTQHLDSQRKILRNGDMFFYHKKGLKSSIQW